MLAEVATGSVIIGVSLIALIAAITIAAIIRYDIDAVLKMWAALGTLLGLLVGTMGTYFFTKDQIQQKDSQIRVAQTALQETQQEKAQLGEKVQDLSRQVASLGSDNGALQMQLTAQQDQFPANARGTESPRISATPRPRSVPAKRP